MKKKVVSALLLLSSLAFIACGANDKNKEANTDNNIIETVTETSNTISEATIQQTEKK